MLELISNPKRSWNFDLNVELLQSDLATQYILQFAFVYMTVLQMYLGSFMKIFSSLLIMIIKTFVQYISLEKFP
jgi:hypothetical protein